MDGLDGMVKYGDAAKLAPRVGIVVEAGTHCHVFIPVGSECRGRRVDVGHAYALDRHVATAFLNLFGVLASSSAARAVAADAVWGGSAALNALGPWRVAVKARSIAHWSPYDRVGVVNADP